MHPIVDGLQFIGWTEQNDHVSALVWMCLSLPKFVFKINTWLDIFKRTPSLKVEHFLIKWQWYKFASFVPCTMWRHSFRSLWRIQAQRCCVRHRQQPSSDIASARTLILDILASKAVRCKFWFIIDSFVR